MNLALKEESINCAG